MISRVVYDAEQAFGVAGSARLRCHVLTTLVNSRRTAFVVAARVVTATLGLTCIWNFSKSTKGVAQASGMRTTSELTNRIDVHPPEPPVVILRVRFAAPKAGPPLARFVLASQAMTTGGSGGMIVRCPRSS